MSQISFTPSLKAHYIDHLGDDRRIANSAKVSTGFDEINFYFDEELSDAEAGLIARLIKDKHTSTLEHNVLTVRADVPIFVAREWMRHRTQSYNEVSGRYKVLEPRFYVPSPYRPLVQKGKSIDYSLHKGSDVQFSLMENNYKAVGAVAWDAYQDMLDGGIAKEVARGVLPVNIMTQFYATANLNNWFKFLTLRTAPNALYEIRYVAAQVEGILEDIWPVAYKSWSEDAVQTSVPMDQ